tara:strand:+ start:4051 stop:4506 length:456 start_codon:yes stop_codon:yes gene_type:complete
MAKISTKAYVIAFAEFRDLWFKDGAWQSKPLGALFVEHINKAMDGEDDAWPNSADGYDNIKAKHNLTRSKIKKDMLNLVHQEHNVTDFKSEPGKRKEAVTSHMSRDERRAYLEAVKDVSTRLDAKMPRLPSFDGSSRSTAKISGLDLLELL